jgi:ABC-2 type transport system ATP-binding protein
MATIAIDGLTKDFGDHRVVDGVGFKVPEGGITGFLGPNGAGKTTTLRMALGLVTPTRGRALINGVPYARLAEPRRVVGALLEATGFHPGRSGRDHLRVLAQITDLPAKRVDEVLELVDLGPAADDRVRTYSLGMKQRLGLAAALLGDPEVLILDEPSNGLDPAGMAWLRDLLKSLAKEGRTVLVSSHVLSEVQQTVDNVVIIQDGTLRYSGPLDGLPGASLEDAFLSLTAAAPEPSAPAPPASGASK